MSRLRTLALVAAVLLAFGAGVGPAAARAATQSPIADCQTHAGKLTRSYTVAELKQALNSMQPSIREYSNCYTAIESALQAKSGVKNLTAGDAGSGGGGGSGTVILIVVVVVVLLGGGSAAFWAYRRNRDGDGGDDLHDDATRELG